MFSKSRFPKKFITLFSFIYVFVFLFFNIYRRQLNYYTKKTAAALVYYSFKRLLKLHAGFRRHMVQLVFKSLVYKVVKKIVGDRMAWGQFDECEITLKELNIIINTVVNSLTGVYHSRIQYPKLKIKHKSGEEEKEDERA